MPNDVGEADGVTHPSGLALGTKSSGACLFLGWPASLDEAICRLRRYRLRGISRDGCVGVDVLHHHRPGSDDGEIADLDVFDDTAPRADIDVVADLCGCVVARTDCRELAEITIVANNGVGMNDDVHLVADIKSVSDFGARQYLYSGFSGKTVTRHPRK